MYRYLQKCLYRGLCPKLSTNCKTFLNMRILHISDFHLSNDKSKIDKSQMVVNGLLKTVETANQEKSIDLVIFSGDAVNKGGEGFDSLEEGFLSFQTILIEPLMDVLQQPLTNFVWCIGNHDINRDLDSKYAELGIAEKLKNLQAVDDFCADKNNLRDIKRIEPFKVYEKSFYQSSLENNYKYGDFESCYIYQVEGKKVGVCCLNTVWRCWDSQTDKGRILLGREQLSRAIDYLKDCDIKIAVSHHDYQWMADFEINEIDKLLVSNFDMYFSGHTHSLNAELSIKPQGRTFKNVASGILSHNIFQKDNYQNSFSIVDYDLDNLLFKLQVYSEEHNKFVLDTSKEWCCPIPAGEEIRKRLEIHQIKIDLKEDNEDLNEHLLTYKTETVAPRSIDGIFVMPSIVRQKDLSDNENIVDTSETIKSISELIESDENFIIFGIKECGKTILLDKIRIEVLNGDYVKDYIPVSLDFRSIKKEKNIVMKISEFWRCRKQTVIDCLKEYNILCLVDNISFSQEHISQLEALRTFLLDYKNVRLIGASREERCSDVIVESDQHKLLDFVRLEINQFDTHQIRTLVGKWFSEDKSKADKVEQIIKIFGKLNLPRTPFSISMFLWILERQNTRPQNVALLVETYLIDLMKSKDDDVAGRNTFDYKHKLNLLGEIAVEMLSSTEFNYQIEYSKYVAKIENFLEILNFKTIYSASKIAQQFIDMGIFLYDNNFVYFRFECFFEFSLAKAMERNEVFRKDILSEANYLDYTNEIVYYTGICRNEYGLLKDIVERMEKEYSGMRKLLFEDNCRIDDIFNVNESLMNKMTADDLIESLPDKETEEDSDRRGDLILRNQCKGNGEVVRKPKGNNVILNLSKQLLLAMNVFKNSEEITIPNLKCESYVKILKYSIAYCLLAKLLTTKKLTEEKNLPIERKKDLHFMLRFLPFLHQKLLYRNLDTVKILEIVKQKMDADLNDDTVSELEKYMSIFLYADIQPFKSNEEIKTFVHSSTRAYIHDACYMNLLDFYYRSTSDDFDEFLINMIADLYFRARPNIDKGLKKGIFIQDLRNRKKNQNKK
jgi:predicted phosphodiesterase